MRTRKIESYRHGIGVVVQFLNKKNQVIKRYTMDNCSRIVKIEYFFFNGRIKFHFNFSYPYSFMK
jgi:hypothetical protein